MTLTPRERRLLCASYAAVTGVSLALRLRSYPSLLRAIQSRAARAAGQTAPLAELETLTRLVEVADRSAPFSPSCLRRSLALAWLLAARGVSSELRVGVMKAGAQLHAHAWLTLHDAPEAIIFYDAAFDELRPHAVEASSR